MVLTSGLRNFVGSTGDSMIVYVITNTINGKQYVGQTVHTLKERWANHCSNNSGCTAIHNAILKYGKDSFKLSVLDTAKSQEELDEKERQWIYKLNTLSPYGYNLKSGGEHVVFTNEVREKLRKANTGKKHSSETRELISQIMKEQWESGERKGHPISEKSRYVLPNYVKEHGSWNKGLPKEQSPLYGKPKKESTKRKIADTLSQPVLCVENNTVYPSAKIAGEFLGVCSANISRCLHGRGHTAGGYHWKWA